MKRRISILAVLLAAGVRCPAQGVDTSAVLAQIRRIAQEEPGSYESLLARASPIAQKAYKDKKWGEVEKALKAAGLKPASLADEFRFVALPRTFTIKNGLGMDLYIRFEVSTGRSQPTYAVPPDNTVMETTVGLSCTLLAEHEQIRKERWFGEGTVVAEALSAWPVTDARMSFPVLEAVDISFGPVWSNDRQDARGYQLQFDLVKGKGEKQTKRRLLCSAAAPQRGERRRGPVENWLSRDDSPPGAARTLAEDLRRVVTEKDPSYHRLLWKATHIVHKAMHGREWSAVAKELNGQELTTLRDDSWQYGGLYKYLVAEKACTTKSGQSMDLFVEVMTGRQTSKSAPTREMVLDAHAVLRAKLDAPYAKVLRDASFGKDTAIHMALVEEEAKNAAEKHPFLDTVEVSYEVLAHKWRPHCWGFSVDLDFTRRKGDAAATSSAIFTIDSELDPPVKGGFTVLVKDYVPRDTLFNLQYHGGTESQSAGEEESGETGSFFLTKKGEPPWRETGDGQTKPVIAYGVGDLKTLPPETPAIEVESREIYDDDLATLVRFTNLAALDLGDSPGITDSGLGRLAGLKKLKSLTLSGELLTGTGFGHFHELRSLTNLKLHSSERLTDRGIAELVKMKQLTRLRLPWAGALTDDHLAQLARLAALRELKIWGSARITDSGVKHISTLSNLEVLTFSHARSVTPSGIAHLAGLKNLREVNLGYMPLKDDAMIPLSKIKSLEYVEMHGLAITDAGIQALGNLVHLKRLYVEGSRGVTTKGVNKLKAGLTGEYELD
jgi:hypothetical protein